MGQSLGGYVASADYSARDPMLTHEGMALLPGGVVVASAAFDGSHTGYTDVIRAGWLLGRLTATGQYVPCKRTLVNGTAGSVTSAVVDNAAAFKIGDAITIGGDAVTLTNVNYSTNTLTWVGAVTIADNDAVIGTDGSQTCVGVLRDDVTLRNEFGTAAAKSAGLVIQGQVKNSMVLGDKAAIVADATSLANLKLIQFSDVYGQ